MSHTARQPTAAASFPTGTLLGVVNPTAPSGFVRAQGGTIGNASSVGSERANADTEALFTLLWNEVSDTYATVSGGRGASAAADYAANKTIALPDARGRHLSGAGTGSGLTARALGELYGAEKHTDVPEHNHGVTDPEHSHAQGGSLFVNVAGTGTLDVGASFPFTSEGAASSATGLTVDNEGVAGGVDHVDPSLALHWILAL